MERHHAHLRRDPAASVPAGADDSSLDQEAFAFYVVQNAHYLRDYQQGSPDPRYQRWIDTYAADEFVDTVHQVLAVTDRTGEHVGPAEAAVVREHFVTTSRYDWLFWDAGYRREAWPEPLR